MVRRQVARRGAQSKEEVLLKGGLSWDPWPSLDEAVRTREMVPPSLLYLHPSAALEHSLNPQPPHPRGSSSYHSRRDCPSLRKEKEKVKAKPSMGWGPGRGVLLTKQVTGFRDGQAWAERAEDSR